MSSKKRNSTAFRQGRFGACEAHLYEFRGRDYPCESEEERVERLAAESIYQGLVYLRRRRTRLRGHICAVCGVGHVVVRLTPRLSGWVGTAS